MRIQASTHLDAAPFPLLGNPGSGAFQENLPLARRLLEQLRRSNTCQLKV